VLARTLHNPAPPCTILHGAAQSSARAGVSSDPGGHIHHGMICTDAHCSVSARAGSREREPEVQEARLVFPKAGFGNGPLSCNHAEAVDWLDEDFGAQRLPEV